MCIDAISVFALLPVAAGWSQAAIAGPVLLVTAADF
jgi:hypothetical protein